MDAQLSHADPNKVSATYNHALYVEPRRKMMQDWADRLDLLEQNKVKAASTHLTIRFDGMPLLDQGAEMSSEPVDDGKSLVLGSLVGGPIERLSMVARA